MTLIDLDKEEVSSFAAFKFGQLILVGTFEVGGGGRP